MIIYQNIQPGNKRTAAVAQPKILKSQQNVTEDAMQLKTSDKDRAQLLAEKNQTAANCYSLRTLRSQKIYKF